MRLLIMAAALALAACSTTGGEEAPPPPSVTDAYIVAAVADPNRPADERARDEARKPAEMLAFAMVRPGQRVADLLPGGGYFTRLFSDAVGPTGRVWGVIAPQQAANSASPPPILLLAEDAHYPNIDTLVTPFTAIAAPEPLDLVWTAQNYHDLHLTRLNVDVRAVNVAVFNALKPGGLYVIIDHAALSGAPVDATADALHRIDEAAVRREVESVGFVFDGEDNALRNPSDAHTLNVFDPAIRGHTDQFALRFRKPG